MRLKNMYRLMLSRLWKKVDALPDSEPIPNQESPMTITSPYALKTYVQQAEEIVAVLTSVYSSYDARLTAATRLDLLKKHSKLTWEKLFVPPTLVWLMEELLADVPKPIKVSPKTQAISAMLHANTPEPETTKISVNDSIRQNRDLEVVRLKGLGKNKSEIAKLVGIHRRSVDRILDKLGV